MECPAIHKNFCSCIQKFNPRTHADVLFIKRDANEKVHLCVLLVPIHQTAGRDVLAHASVSGLIMSPRLLFVSLSTAAKHSLTLGIMAQQDVSMSSHKYWGWVFFGVVWRVLTLVHDGRES